MSGLFGKKQTVTNEQTRIGALRVQNSSRGLPVGIVYGKTRVSPNLIRFSDLVSTPNTSSTETGGKGGGGVTTVTTTYTYTAVVMLGLGEGPLPLSGALPMVGTVWEDKAVTSGANLGLTEFRGTAGQAPWSTIVTLRPTEARAMRGHAYVAHPSWLLNQQAGLQNLSFELRGRLFENDCEPDVNVASVVSDFLTNTAYGVPGFAGLGSIASWLSYCNAAGFRVSPAYITQRPAAETVDELCKVGNAAPFWSEGQLKIVPYADTAISRTPRVASATFQLTEDFSNGLAPFANVSGNAALFTISSGTYGNQLNIASQTSANVGQIQRTFNATQTDTFSVKFKVNANAPNDAASVTFAFANSAQFLLIPMRELSVDPAQRPTMSIGGDAQVINATRLPFGVWFQLDVSIGAGAGNTTYQLSTPGNGAVANSGALPSGHTTITFDSLNFFADTPTATADTSYTDIVAVAGNAVCLDGSLLTFTPDLTVQYALQLRDFRPSRGQAPVRIRRKRPADCFNVVQVACLDRADGYNKAVVEAPDQGLIEQFGRRVAPVIQAEMICDLTVARAVAQTALQRLAYLRNTYQFTLGKAYGRLEPMDIVSLTEPVARLTARPVRITAIDEDEEGLLGIEAEDLFIGIGTAGNYPVQQSNGTVINTGADPGNANAPVIFQPPVELSGIPQIWIGASGGSSWGGAEIWASDDDITYAKVGIITSPARYGTLTANWPTSADPDTTGNLSVSLANSGGSITAATTAQANAGDTLSYVGSANAPEFIAYSAANLTAPFAYTMGTFIRRGQFCSFARSHLTGEAFMRLDAAVAKVPIEESRVGTTAYIKLRSYNTQGGGLQALDALTAIQYVVQPVGLIVTNGVVPSTIQAGQLLCIPETAQYTVTGRMTNLGRINLHGRLIIQ